MKIVESNVQLLEQRPGIEGLYEHMETVGRISHMSDKVPGSSSLAFLNRIKELGHWAVFDLGTVYLKVPIEFSFLPDSSRLYNLFSCKWVEDVIWKDNHYVTTTYRTILKLGLEDLMERLWCDPIPGLHKLRVTSKWVCSRSIANEVVRHRAFSFIQESTRFINYSREKFGTELTFIVPEWVEKFRTEEKYKDLGKVELWNALLGDNVPVVSRRMKTWEDAESEYLWEVLGKELIPGDARGCLPGDLKTEFYMTGYLDDYYREPGESSPEKLGFFYLREAKDAHPDIRVLAQKLDEQMKERYYEDKE